MLSILINAYACSPGMGSEPGMAWNWCVNLAKYCELHIITEGEFRDNIEKELPLLPQGKNMHFYYNPVSDKVRKMCWNQGEWRFYFHYAKWQKRTLEIAQNIMNTTIIDIVHQLNMVGFREPGELWRIKNKPFIWGPIAGIGSIPYSFLAGGGIKFSSFFILKNIITKLQLKFAPRVVQALKKAEYVITATSEAKKAIWKYHHTKSIQINETGCYINLVKSKIVRDKQYFDILWVGRFIYTKQLKLALDTIAKIRQLKGLRFHIVGQAYNSIETEKYMKYARDSGISDICIFYRQIPNKEVHELMQKCHLFFFTSIFEATSTVILEALSNGLPILCFNRCGFGPLIDDTIGNKIQLTTPERAVEEFAERIIFFHSNKELLQSMSINCIKRQKELSWENKAKQMVQLYKSCIK